MRSVALLLFGIHLAFAKYYLSLTCEDETVSVTDGTVTCRFPFVKGNCCVMNYTIFTEYFRTQVCRKEFSTDHCVEMDSFSCPYIVKAAMTTKFVFFVKITCGVKTPEFRVNLRETSTVSGKTFTNAPTDKPDQRHRDELFEVKVAAGCVLPLIVFAAIMGVIVWMKSSQGKRLLRGYLRGRTTDSDPVSDQQMQRYPSSESMERPITF
ncbi:uncharacterized protein [Paramisgurnus dabryanus]|uniref:uncharacterized protein n=1 Tax=Paramisgurnus dabryanus TaxID=90735 RepID=UPI0031F38050